MAWRASSVALALAVLPAAAERFDRAEPCMGTVFRITVDGAPAEQAMVEAFARAHSLDRTLSDYRPDSEVRRLGDARPGQWAPVSEDLARVLGAALDVARRTGGRFDPTLGPLTRIWRERQVPSDAELARAKQRIGWRKVRLDRRRGRVKFAVAGMQLDFGGIGKGFAAAEMLRVLRQHGARRALVAAGGDLAIGDAPEGRAGWRVAIGNRVVELANAAVSTSGDSEQRFEAGGQSYSHILDPETGTGTPRRPTVTVIGKDGAVVDALATALSTLPPEEAYQRAVRLGLAALVGDRPTRRFPQ